MLQSLGVFRVSKEKAMLPRVSSTPLAIAPARPPVGGGRPPTASPQRVAVGRDLSAAAGPQGPRGASPALRVPYARSRKVLARAARQAAEHTVEARQHAAGVREYLRTKLGPQRFRQRFGGLTYRQVPGSAPSRTVTTQAL